MPRYCVYVNSQSRREAALVLLYLTLEILEI